MFPVTITIHNDVQLNAVMAAMAGKEITQHIKAEPAPVKAQPKPEVKKEELKTKETPPAEAETKEAKEETKKVSYDEVAAAITKVSREKNRDAAVAVLAKFGAKRGQDLLPEQYADVISECEEVLA